MKIKIAEKNSEKLSSVIKKAEGKATARTISVADLLDFAKGVDHRLDELGCAKAARKGVAFIYCQSVGCNSYKYAAEATKVVITRGATGWFLTECCRSATNTARGSRSDWLVLTDEAAQSVANAAIQSAMSALY